MICVTALEQDTNLEKLVANSQVDKLPYLSAISFHFVSIFLGLISMGRISR